MAPLADQSWRAVPVPWQRRWGRRLFLVLVLALIAVLAGLAYEPLAEALQLRATPPPGRVVQAEGLDLHLQVAGPPSRPTVLLFNPWGMPSASWGWILPKVAQTNLTVRWDPPGYAWSGYRNAAMDAPAEADRLHTMLKAYDVSGPYLLVGSGLGALEARAFAVRYPDEVGGMVLLDPWHQPLMADPGPRIDALEREASLRRFSWHRLRAWWNKEPLPEFGLPPAEEQVVFASSRTVKQARAQAAELRGMAADFETAQANQTLGQKPLVILTSAALDKDGSDGPWAPGTQAARVQMDELLAKLSTQGKHAVIAGATPTSLLCRQDLADQVAQAIQSAAGR